MNEFSPASDQNDPMANAVGLPRPVRHVAVVGAGIAGLAAAHRVTQLDPACELVVFEAGDRAGGVLWTVHEAGFQVEQSADNFITTVPYGLELCRSLGLGDRLVQTNPACRQTYVVHRGRLHKLPDGFLMMAPTRLWPLALTPLLSPLGKLRAGLEYFIPPRLDDADESMAAFVRRRLGREAFDRLVEPLVSAVYAADLERLSVDATLSRFRDMERQHGSLIRALRREMAARRKARREAETQSGARYSLFVTLRDGLSSLVEALVARLPRGALRLGSPVERLAPTPDGRWDVWSRGRSERFDAVVMAAPAHVAGPLLTPVDRELGAGLGQIEHSGTAIVSLGFRTDQIGHPLRGMGAVVPAAERSPILAVSFSSRKYVHRAPEGHDIFRVFVGGARAPEMAELDDSRLVPLVLAELRRLLRIQGEPVYAAAAHWPRTMPQYHVGHRARVEEIERRAARLSGLALAGNAYRGVGLPDCIHTGQQAAARVLGATGSA
ncbi:MAG: protoporphyrinogen oxidase [Pirellulales bacterium]|nr:protoporphyrinogen oxidase [Pirellulales bacterium]